MQSGETRDSQLSDKKQKKVRRGTRGASRAPPLYQPQELEDEPQGLELQGLQEEASLPQEQTEEACFPKWFFEYDAPVDPPDTVFSGAKPLTTSGGFSGAVRLQEAYTLGLAAAEILRNKTYLSPTFQAPLHLQLPLQDRVHVLLLSRLSDSPCCVRTAKEYREHLTSTTSEKPTLGFSFPSQSEARAFSVGAGLLDLPAFAGSP